VSNGTLALVWRFLAAILIRVHEKEEKVLQVESPEKGIPEVSQDSPGKRRKRS